MKNRNRANIILFAAFIMFITTVVLNRILGTSFIISLLAFVSESALIGGVADWFAVTALFKKPLGFPWHTAIIPNNRAKLIDSIELMVRDELLNADSIRAKLDSIDIVGILDVWIRDKSASRAIAEVTADLIDTAAGRLDTRRSSRYLEVKIKKYLRKTPLSSLAVPLLKNHLEEAQYNKWMSRLLPQLYAYVEGEAFRDFILKIIKDLEVSQEDMAASLITKFFLSIKRRNSGDESHMVSELFQGALLELLSDLSHPGHEFHTKIREHLTNLVNTLHTSPVLGKAVEDWKKHTVRHMPLSEFIEKLIETSVSPGTGRTPLIHFASLQVEQYWAGLTADEGMRTWFNVTARSILIKILKEENHLIGEIVKETLQSFTNEKLNDFINDKAGNDLQWIRINGSIVGAIFGLLVFLFLRLVYDPFVTPYLMGLLGRK